jgi:phosphate butyryltransferase
MSITKLDQILEAVKSKPKKRLVAAYANDAHTIGAVNNAVELGIVEATLVGDQEVIKKVCAEHGFNINNFEIVHEPVDVAAAAKAVELVNQGKANVIMKGLVSTDKYMRAILNKEKGLMPPKAVLSHVTVMETSTYHKLMIVGDVAVIPAPDFEQKVAITNYLITTAHALGIECPKVAIIAATEQVSYKIPACVDAAVLSKMADRGQLKKAYVDGPLALDVAIDPESVQIKGLKGPVAGDADCMLFPNIEAANVFYKANTKLAGGELAALVMGAKVPAILSSRGDSEKTKLYSIALAALMG